MKSKICTIYSCDFCKKRLIRKQAMEKHEEFCFMNPVNTPACQGCEFIKEIKKEIYYYTGRGEETRTAKAFHCIKLDKELYPISAARRGLPEKYPETFEEAELMPSKCEHSTAFNFII